ncbi:prephenate dehydrogenase/arogenate dehydrogenase family protein [Iocasia frigidifontis]|uniref:Prephenate dehydrogenase/arogenate dehydrogenase family protein n=1 Tax=Iocasia fonsfrigidae TaxID=2682810 RepID=A0A8A7KDA7_9FIRM|nr:NAD(P)-dependent oxidoreductase [Iocasia fonsfrigidae]QTL99766.1 prephenate dehydrogenase/arogenate dehydrogenase family protein [Iocasia fonsfrigidae]
MKKIGFIGLGIMGESMCANILKKRDEKVIVFDIKEEKIKRLVQLGAIAASSAKEVGEKADVIISMVPKSEHVKAVGQELLPVLSANKIWIDMSTIKPAVSKELAAKVRETGAVMIDAPVVKSKSAAIDGTLGIYVGGDKKSYQKIEDILLCMGQDIIYLGDNGAGLVMKICHNMLVGQIQNAVNEMITLANKANIEIDDFITAISYGGGQNFYLDTKGKNIKQQDFTTAFSIKNMSKDVSIAKDLIEEFNLTLPGTEIVHTIYQEAMEANYGKEDFSATIKVVQNRN